MNQNSESTGRPERGADSLEMEFTWKSSLGIILAVLQSETSDQKAKAVALGELQRMAMAADYAKDLRDANKEMLDVLKEVRSYCELVEWIDYEGTTADDAPGFVSLVNSII